MSRVSVVRMLFLWDCRRNQIYPKIKGYQNQTAKEYETERKQTPVTRSLQLPHIPVTRYFHRPFYF